MEKEEIRGNKNKKIFFTQLRLHVIQIEKKRETNKYIYISRGVASP